MPFARGRDLGGPDEEPLGGEEERVGGKAGIEDQARPGGAGDVGAGRHHLLCADGKRHGVAGRLIGDHVTGLQLVEVDEVADIVRQEDGGAGHAGPDRLRVVSHRDVELLIVGSLLDRRGEVQRRDVQDPRELTGLLAADQAARPVTLGRDLVHGGVLTLEEDLRRVMGMDLPRHGVRADPDGRPDQYHAQRGDRPLS